MSTIIEHPRCPSCGSDSSAKILYGRVRITKQVREDLEAGHVVLGGCVVPKDTPQWHCLGCGKEWQRDSKNKDYNETTSQR